jgi:hypothetical protein
LQGHNHPEPEMRACIPHSAYRLHQEGCLRHHPGQTLRKIREHARIVHAAFKCVPQLQLDLQDHPTMLCVLDRSTRFDCLKYRDLFNNFSEQCRYSSICPGIITIVELQRFIAAMSAGVHYFRDEHEFILTTLRCHRPNERARPECCWDERQLD